MHDKIVAAVNQTFGFRQWPYSNEYEVKHELFYQLSRLAVAGTSLADLVSGAPTCRLHAEGKVVNGKPQKADILICDPFKRQNFNYAVTSVIEIKQTLTSRTVALEIEKFRKYETQFDGLYLVAPFGSRNLTIPTEVNGTPVFALRSEINLGATGRPLGTDSELDLSPALAAVELAIRQTLEQYGNGRAQFHSFFWCNYEHETSRGHSFPSEGDFNAQLYRRLREKLPSSVMIRSEVHPTNQPKRRVDFVIADHAGRWAIPVEIKMNWDQFKPKFKDGKQAAAEATVIIERLKGVSMKFRQWRAILVVIQGVWQLKRDIKSSALPILEACPYPLDLFYFDEHQNQVMYRTLGRKD